MDSNAGKTYERNDMNEFSLSDLAAVVNNRNGDGFDGGNGGWWILLLFILLGGFNGNRGWGNQGGYGAGNVGGNELYPWLNNAETVNSGFRDQMLQTGIQGVNTGIQSLATQLCNCCGEMQMALANGFAGVNLGMANGFAGVNQTLCNGLNGVNMGMQQGFNAIEQGANARQMANMQTQFGMQTAMQQGFNAASQQTAQFAYDTGLGMAQQTATILAEHCSDRAVLSDGVRDIIANQTAMAQRQIDNQNMWGQRLSDQLCQYRMEDKDNEIAQLRQQVQMQNLAASQNAQTAAILANNEAQTTALEQYLAPVPRPAYIVQNPNCCPQQFACGCAA